MKNNKKHTMALVVLTICTMLVLSSCNLNDAVLKKEPVSKTDFLLNTTCTVSIYEAKGEKSYEELATEAIELCRSYEEKLSRTIKNSDVNKINSNKGSYVEVSEETVFLLDRAIYYSEMSKGKFDVTIGSLAEAWDFNGENPKVPEEKDIENLILGIDYKNISIKGNTVMLAKDSGDIDLGAIAKGFIADKLAEDLKKKYVSKAIINLGGNVVTVGEKKENVPWTIGIKKPFTEDGSLVGKVFSEGSSVVTSGIYERQFEENGIMYHHVLDVKTGFPAEEDLLGVTIISKKSMEGDALATICLLLGYEEGRKLVESIDGVEGVFIKKNNEIIATDKSTFVEIK